jgi:hypothetical protein
MRCRRAPVAIASALAALACGAPIASATVVGQGTPASCTSAAVVAAVRAGGTISFSCGPKPVTITMRDTAEVSNTTPMVTIDGGGKVTLSGAGARRILYMNTCDKQLTFTTTHCQQQATPRLVLEGLTFVDGLSPAGGGTGGGAVFAFGGQVTITDSTFQDNSCTPASGSAAGGGAVDAVWQLHAHPVTIRNDQFTGNVCDSPGGGGGGGALFVSQNALLIDHSTFDANRCVSTGPDVGGGAVRAFEENSGPVVVSRSTFDDNVCSNGGALSSIDASWTVRGSTFTGNQAIGVGANPAMAGTPGGGSGGAIYNDGDRMHLEIDNSRLQNNQAREGGGAVFFVSNDKTGTMTIDDSRLIGNPNMGFQTPGLPGIFFLGARPPVIKGSTLR